MKMAAKSSSLIIWAILLLINILQFFPSCLAARNLLNAPQPSVEADGSNGYTENNDQSKSGVDGSQVRHAASASDESAPTNGRVVQRPPTSCYRSVSSNSNGGQTVTTYCNNGATRSTTNESNSVTYNGNRGSGQVYSSSNAMYEPPSDYEPPSGQEDPSLYFPPPPPFPYYP
ncbi:hypothetical protein Ddye_030694 [Dipteronia dyeriana]|uniref:Uncharacterized protein n=1 Tax=Dipteronia dyeriana TaxID=168575 RepID=A0AAD9TGY0_9ROSI|nr:hypothetical protein Ddye_030694 [Dipteronia dyeriana]